MAIDSENRNMMDMPKIDLVIEIDRLRAALVRATELPGSEDLVRRIGELEKAGDAMVENCLRCEEVYAPEGEHCGACDNWLNVRSKRGGK
jgi:hypothetical protein